MRLRVQSCPCSVVWRSRVAVSCGVGCRRGSDPALLWLWRRPVATAPIQTLAWEPPYAVGAALKKQKKKQNKQKKNSQNKLIIPPYFHYLYSKIIDILFYTYHFSFLLKSLNFRHIVFSLLHIFTLYLSKFFLTFSFFFFVFFAFSRASSCSTWRFPG